MIPPGKRTDCPLLSLADARLQATRIALVARKARSAALHFAFAL
jgi:hypothetical protein